MTHPNEKLSRENSIVFNQGPLVLLEKIALKKYINYGSAGQFKLPLAILIMISALILGTGCSILKPTSEENDLGVKIHETGFETRANAFRRGPLVKQNNWFAYMGTNEEAPSVTTELSKTGSGSLKIDGSKVKAHPFGVIGGFYGRKLSYDPLENEKPLVELSADLNLIGAVADNQCKGGIALILDGGAFIGIGPVADGEVRLIFENQLGDAIVGPSYEVGEWANIKAIFDFEQRIITGYFNDQLVGRVPFHKNAPASVTAVGVIMVAGPDETGKKPEDIAGINGYVDNLSVTAYSRDERTGSAPIRGSALNYIPKGKFEMGNHFDPSDFPETLHSVIADPDELPIHSVSVNTFYLSPYQVTNMQYVEALNWALKKGVIEVVDGVIRDAENQKTYGGTTISDPLGSIIWTGKKFKVLGEKLPMDDPGNRTQHPATHVSWFGAAAYCNWRSLQEGLKPCYDPVSWDCDFSATGYRLPTEAEREYAARGGQHDPYLMFPWGNSIDGCQANFNGSGDQWEALLAETTPVGYYDGNQEPKGPDMGNGYGLYDMAGNHFEWANDWYDPEYYSKSPSDNPRGPATGEERAVRNGSWLCNCLANLRVANRLSSKPDNPSFAFRVARSDFRK